jgi:hypothetical protein
VQVELVRRDPQDIAVRSCQQDAVVVLVAVPRGRATLEEPAQPRDEGVHAPRRTRRWGLGPELVDDLLDRNDLVGMQEQQREKRALLPAPERKLASLAIDLQGAENPEVHAVPIVRTANLAPAPPQR